MWAVAPRTRSNVDRTHHSAPLISARLALAADSRVGLPGEL